MFDLRYRLGQKTFKKNELSNYKMTQLKGSNAKDFFALKIYFTSTTWHHSDDL